MQRIVVLGAGYAGMTAAGRLRLLRSGEAEVLLVNRSHRFVERVRLHQVAAGQLVVQPRIERRCHQFTHADAPLAAP